MLMLVWRETKLKVRLVQPRRHCCHHCGNRFVYLANDSFEKLVRGVPYVSLVAGESDRQQRVLRLVRDEVSSRTLEKKGEATCPYCGQVIEWAQPYDWAARVWRIFGKDIRKWPANAGPDPRSMKDAEWVNWTSGCEREGVDPVQFWWMSFSSPTSDEMILSLPIAEEVGTTQVSARGDPPESAI